jgi:hypothetical protein
MADDTITPQDLDEIVRDAYLRRGMSREDAPGYRDLHP